MKRNTPRVGSKKRELLDAVVKLHAEEENKFGWTRCRECHKQYPCPTLMIARLK